MSITAKNLHREISASPTCGCITWIHHWENNSGKKAGTCSVLGCSQPACVGGHVQKKDLDNNSWFIIPICKTCNTLDHEYKLKANTISIHIAKTDLCGSGDNKT